jgi:hypothetical protein
LKKDKFTTPEHMLQLVQEWEHHLYKEMQELSLKCEQMENSLKCRLEVFQVFFKFLH